MTPGPFSLLVRNAAEIVTCAGDPGSSGEEPLRIVERGAIGILGERIEYVGPESGLPRDALALGTEVLDAAGGVVTPGLIDPHTHLVFAGDRAGEFELRARGATYLEIAAAGGGIAATVAATRACSEDELLALARPRLQRLLERGVTTAEVKSGYGLSVEDELKQLRVVRRLGREQPVELVPTLLCAHAVPEEFRSARERYVSLCIQEIIPAVAAEGLARFCDAFCEAGAFTRDEARAILQAGRDQGLRPRVHADQLTPMGGAELAAELGAASADHLEHVSDAGIDALARAGVSAVLVPTSTMFLRAERYAPGRRLRDAGVNVALATNLNPGSSMTESVSLVMGLACLFNGLTPAEAMWAMTRGAAHLLGLEEHGRLSPGDPADLVVFGCSSWKHLPYHLAVNHARTVVKRGRIVARPASLATSVCG
ncbi:MAG TPA: imidazolonepropionase [Myxococcaceae bacterium]|nr:imidazolonepropionase [Myxococcaceae bacterium]